MHVLLKYLNKIHFYMQMMTKKGRRRFVIQLKILSKMFETTNFRRSIPSKEWVVDMFSKFSRQIPNSDYAIDGNVFNACMFRIYLGSMDGLELYHVKILCCCNVWTEKKNVHRKTGNKRHLLSSWKAKVRWYFVLKKQFDFPLFIT